MDIGITGDIIVILRKPIDDDEPTRLYARLIQASDAGVTVRYGEGDDEDTYFIPFTNIRAIGKSEPEAEAEGQQWTQ